MSYLSYKKEFDAALHAIDKKVAAQQHLQLFVCEVLDAIAFKAYKTEWSSDHNNPMHAEGRIFFSVWVTDKTIAENKLYYNIQALKLRKFKNYVLTSRDFALQFRQQFAKHQKHWPNVSVHFGPATLMQGWIPLNEKTMGNDIVELLGAFTTISPVLDDLLAKHNILHKR
ncbi:MAG: hypothetical protein JST86_15935 [Bacteroidetes bacterium]|nr:hypothetical protein [Bacteroidota bacterium]